MTIQTVNPPAFYQGDTVTIPFTITDGTNTPVDITLATFMWVAWNISYGNVVTKTSDNGLAFGDPTKGQVAATLEFADTATVAPTQYTHMLEKTLNGNTNVEAQGTLVILKNYTLL